MATRARRLQRPATGWWPRGSAGRRRALRHWARAVALPREVGTLIPPPRVPAGALAPPAAPPPSLGFARDWQTSDALRRESAEGWLFETVDRKLSKTQQHT